MSEAAQRVERQSGTAPDGGGRPVSNTIAVAGARDTAGSGSSGGQAPLTVAQGQTSGRQPATFEDLAKKITVAAPRLPMLEASLNLLPEMLAQRLREAWVLPIEARSLAISLETEALLGEPTRGAALVAQFTRKPESVTGHVEISAETLCVLLESLLGGARGGAVAAHGRERFSHLERCLMEPFVGHILQALTECFRSSGPLALQFEGWTESAERPAGAEVRQVVQEIALKIGGLEGRIRIVLPFRLLEPLLPALGAVYPGEALGHDREWRRHLSAQVLEAQVDIDVVLQEALLPVAELSHWRIGEVLPLGGSAESGVVLRSGGLALASGRLGRSSGRIALRLETAAATVSKERPSP